MSDLTIILIALVGLELATPSVHQPMLGQRFCSLIQVFVQQIGLQFQPAEHAAQQVVGYVQAVCDALADRFGFFEKQFGFCLFHGLTVGQFNQRRNAEIQGVSR